MDRGPDITIQFRPPRASRPGKTRIRHKSVDIGTVKSVKLSEDNKAVLVQRGDRPRRGQALPRRGHALLGRAPAHRRRPGLGARHAARRLVHRRGSRQVDARSATTFVGLETPPVDHLATCRARASCCAPSDLGSLDINSPVYFRGVLAGPRRLHRRAARTARKCASASSSMRPTTSSSTPRRASGTRAAPS